MTCNNLNKSFENFIIIKNTQSIYNLCNTSSFWILMIMVLKARAIIQWVPLVEV